MKRFIAVLIIICTVFGFSGCTTSEKVELTCDEIAQAYTDAGFYVKHYHEESEDGSYCHINIQDAEELLEDTDVIYFTFFESEDEAKAFTKDNKWNLILYIFGVMFGEFRWLKSKTYGDISYQYWGKQMIKPFNDLVKSKS